MGASAFSCRWPAWPSWVALTGVALYLLAGTRSAAGTAPLRRGAWVLLATAGTLFWGRVVLVVMGAVGTWVSGTWATLNSRIAP